MDWYEKIHKLLNFILSLLVIIKLIGVCVMNDLNQIIFNTAIAKMKPESIKNKSTKCPFCDLKQLKNIIEIDGPIIWLENKYPVLENTFQTVIIETDHCNSDISQYSLTHLNRLFQFAIHKWLELTEDNRYKSVILFKNHGYLSGGSIKHPHMQIVGFREINYLDSVDIKDFEGVLIDKKENVEWNLSKYPRMGFYEWNIILHDLNGIDVMAGYIQKCVYYLLNEFFYPCDSYNLFFYHFQGVFIAKIIPRYVVSPLFIGYSIRQVGNNLEEIVSDMQRYFISNRL